MQSISLFLISIHFSERIKAWLYKPTENKKTHNSLPMVILHLNDQFDTQGSRAVIPHYKPCQRVISPLGPHLELTQCWVPLSPVSCMTEGKERCSTSEVRSCPFSSHQIIYLLAKTKLIPAQRKLMRPIHCSRICHRSWCSPRWVTDWNIGAKFSIYIVEFIHQENCLIRGHLSVVSQKMPLHCTND